MNCQEKCSVSYCESMQTGSKGYCEKHYMQINRHGKIKEKMSTQGCKVEGCERKHHIYGYCERHSQQIKKYGEIKGNVKKTKFDPNDFVIDKENKTVILSFTDALGNILKKKSLIDLEDFEKVRKYKWYIARGYARTKAKLEVALHQFILDISFEEGKFVDHINMNKLDNRKSNLRFCNKGQNSANSKIRVDNKTGFKGIFKYSNDKWKARIGGKHIGSFASPEEAAMVYDLALLKKYDVFARTNFERGGDSN